MILTLAAEIAIILDYLESFIPANDDGNATVYLTEYEICASLELAKRFYFLSNVNKGLI